MAYKVVHGFLKNTSSSCGGCGSRHYSDNDVTRPSLEAWKKDAKFKYKRLRKTK
ncbi:hypothetical protein [Yersinia phage vB_YenM_P778]